MYESFFKLKRKPFELVPDPDFIYLSRSHKKALTYLDYGIRERAGFILLTGEIGSGKTTLIRNLLKKKYDKVVLAKLFNTRVSTVQLLAMINDDFGLPATGKDKVSLIRELNDFLLDQSAAGRQPILIIDEAQNLEANLLEEIRMLSNLESSHGKLLQIMLVGQPELRETLSAPELLQLRQRININCHLKALSQEETAEYIMHRMEVAGNRRAIEFPVPTLELIHMHSRGIPRLINILCDFIMLSAFADEARSVSLGLVQEIIGDLDFENHYWGSRVIEGAVEGDCVIAGQPQQTQPFLFDLAQRIESVEKISLEVPAALRDVGDSLVLLKEEFSLGLARCEARVSALQVRLAAAADESEVIELSPLPDCGAGAGFARPTLDGADADKT